LAASTQRVNQYVVVITPGAYEWPGGIGECGLAAVVPSTPYMSGPGREEKSGHACSL
jgi:hypothetical protein